MHSPGARSVLSFSGLNRENALAQVELHPEPLKEITLAEQAKAHAVHTLREASVGVKDDAVSEIDRDRGPVGRVQLCTHASGDALRHLEYVESERLG